MSSVYSFVILQNEEFRKRVAVRSTEARIRLTVDLYDLVYASIDKAEILTKFETDFKDEIDGNAGIRMMYEYIMDLDHEHYNTNSDIDDARNELEKKDSSIHRRLLLFARINNILTEESVKEYFGRFRGSWNVDPLNSGGEDDRRFA